VPRKKKEKKVFLVQIIKQEQWAETREVPAKTQVEAREKFEKGLGVLKSRTDFSPLIQNVKVVERTPEIERAWFGQSQVDILNESKPGGLVVGGGPRPVCKHRLKRRVNPRVGVIDYEVTTDCLDPNTGQFSMQSRKVFYDPESAKKNFQKRKFGF